MGTDNSESLRTSYNIQHIYDELKKEDLVTIQDLVNLLSTESIYLLILILIAPFLFPVSLPGISTPFGLLIILLAFSSLFNRPLRLSTRVATTEISTENLDKIFNILLKVLKYVEKVFHPRGNLTDNTYILKINSIIIIILAFVLGLPLPIPFADFTTAIAILILAVSNLEHDTLFMIIGYVATVGSIYYIYTFSYLAINTIIRVLHAIGITL